MLCSPRIAIGSFHPRRWLMIAAAFIAHSEVSSGGRNDQMQHFRPLFVTFYTQTARNSKNLL